MAENTILVVDDEQRMRKLVRDFLTKQDFMVLEDGGLADMQGDPSVFKSADHYADSSGG